MKIRIKDNSIRFRLTKSDVSQLKKDGLVTSKTVISPEHIFEYALKVDHDAQHISASFDSETITMIVPAQQANIITDTDEITIQGIQRNGEEGDLFLLIEKDLQCLDPTHEDQSDMYENKNTVC